jgi:predicted ABC-type ATPase
VQQYVIDVYRVGKTSAENPIAIIIGAQPGSGKSMLENVARDELSNNGVVCSLDELREFHPRADKIKSDYEAYYPVLTGDYAWRWREGLMAYCVENRLNFIMEVTFANGADINKMIQMLKENEYRVDLKLLAVHPKLSLLGTQVRYEKQKLEEASGRIINKQDHDERYNNLVPSVLMVQSAALYDKMQIYGRNVASDRSSEIEGIHLIDTNPPNAVQVFQEVFDQPWPKKMENFFEQEMAKVIRLKEARNAPAEEIATFRKEMKFKYPSPRDMQEIVQEQKAAEALKLAQEQREQERQRQAEEERQRLSQTHRQGQGQRRGGPHR